ncbi:response regulator transcription factor [Hazenella sp. IB182357]|uniref:Response regulator transcription factor n=1 Tax=Polycladospora coralii TaxID=2771432 RepID=A0A926RV00_9BACL|nr:response regulator transcription factor [Polycladospora coralii]MBS7530937.1 response regulator transcription factor [Polycladospora coralii]
MEKILIADDDREIVQLVAESLEEEGFEIRRAYSGRAVVDALKEKDLDLVLLDIMMPEIDGLEVCRQVRNELMIPIVFLSARDRELDRIIGLEVGGDDYITKPFHIQELVARVKAHLRREKRRNHQANANGPLQFQHLSIDKDTYEVWLEQEKVDLSTKEFQILVYLAENRNQVLSREQIYDAVWGRGEFGDLNTVTVHIKNLRRKIDPFNDLIKTVWGTGYKFVGDHK